jgi:transposase
MIKSVMHTIILPLKTNARDLQIVSESLNIVGKLRNAALGEMLQRIESMTSDPQWSNAGAMDKGADKSTAYRALYKQYKISQFAVVGVCHAHWKDSSWMGDRVGGRVAIALAPELWQNLQEYLYGRADRPRFKPARERNVVWNSDNKSGLLLRDGHIKWSIKTKRKCLDIPLDLSSISRPRREWLEQALETGKLRRVGIKREMVRGQERLFALICLEGSPYRSTEYLREAASGADLVGLDLGPTWLAMVSETEAKEISIATEARIKANAGMRALERRRKRAADRSRAASNQHARRTDGRSIKGVRQPQRSKNGQKRERLLVDAKRRDRINRQQDRSRAVRAVMQQGRHIALEDLDYRSWQKSLFGRRMLITSPGDFVSRLQREAELLGGSVTLINPCKARASQTCLCGAHTGKKQLSERTHHCLSCGLEAPRDMVSAALVRELALAGEQSWNEELAQASGTKSAAVELIQQPRRTSSFLKTAAGSCGVKQGTEKASAESTVLLCEKQKSDPEDKTHSSSHVPTCEQPAVLAGASQKAAVKKTKNSQPLIHSG